MTVMSTRVEGVLERSRKIKFSATMMLWATAIFYGIGWVVAKALAIVWAIVTFCWVAMVVGFTNARTRKGG